MSLPPTLSESRIEGGHLFARLMYFAACAGAVVHAGLLAVFHWHGWQPLVMLNVASVLLYLGIAVGLRDPRRRRLMAALAVGEIVVHAVIAVLTLGWETGFHMYLLALVPIAFIGTSSKMPVKWFSALVLAAGYVLLRYATHELPRWYDVPAQAVHWLEYFNIVAMVLLLSFGAFLHYGAVLTGERRLMDLASTDPLTGLANRRRWLDEARRAHRMLQEEGRPFCVLLADADHFKVINDSHGHGGGDQALRVIGQALTSGLRGLDTVGRWGGEEFAILLTGARQQDAVRVAEELRKHITALDLQLDGRPVLLSITLGAAQAQHGETVESVLQRADEALYRGKAAGRNRVEVARTDAAASTPA